MSDERLINRKERRAYLKKYGYLKDKNNLKFNDWCEWLRNNIKEGKNRHRSNEDTWRNIQYEFLSEKESKITSHLRERGYDKSAIDSYLKNWHKTI